MESLGDVIPILTTASRAERATLRVAREMARREAAEGRMAQVAPGDGLAATAAELHRLTTCHRGEYGKLDWRSIAAREAMALPVRTHEREKAARRALATWQPTWQERMFGDEAQRRRQLHARVFEAAREDEAAFQKACRAAETFNAEALTARRLFEFDPKAIREAVALKSRLATVRDGMNGVGLALPGGGRLVAVVDAIQEGDIPHERVAAGDPRAVRREPISARERRQIHFAAICAVGLRVGAELICVLPADAVEVVVECELPAPAGRRAAPQPVMQLMVSTKALAELDWRNGDPAALAGALGARMDWSLERGFSPIRLAPLSAMGRPLAKTA